MEDLSWSNGNMWKSLIVEFLGTFTLVLIGCMTVASFGGNPENAVAACFAFGLAFMGIIYAWGAYSGAHVNPAISLGFAVAGRMNWLLMFGYWIAQFLGAIAAAALITYFLPASTGYGASNGRLTRSTSEYYDLWKAVVVEMVLTFLLVVGILFITKNKIFSAVAGLAIGLTLTFCMFAGYEWTGASLNPARSLGPAIFAGELGIYWVYFLGPLLGAILAALIFRLINMDWAESCCNLKDDCGKDIKDECGNPIKTCKRPAVGPCGKTLKDDCGKVQYETYIKQEEKLSYM